MSLTDANLKIGHRISVITFLYKEHLLFVSYFGAAMPRVAREIELGFPMHVTQRGNNRQNIFRDEEDKEFYCALSCTINVWQKLNFMDGV